MATTKWVGGTTGSTTTWAQSANWSAAAIPATGDIVVVPAGAAYNIAGTDVSATLLHGFTVEAGYTGTIGSAGTPLKICLKDTSYYSANLAGSGVTYLDVKDYNQINVTAAGSAPAAGQYALNLTGSTDNATATASNVNICCDSTGSVSIAANAAETMEANAITVTGGNVTIGSGATDYDAAASIVLVANGGTVVNSAAMATITNDGAELTHLAGAVGTFNVLSGTTYYRAAEAVTTAMNITGTVDCTDDLRARTWAATNLYKGAVLSDPNRTITFTTAVQLNQCKMADVTLDLGANIKITRAAI